MDVSCRVPHHHHGQEWMHCTLCRSHQQSMNVLSKARQRKISWPKPQHFTNNPIQDPAVYTSIDDAFATVLQYMSSTTRQCKRYYRSCSPATTDNKDGDHCGRFHTPEYAVSQRKNPLQSAEDVHVVVHPGTYAVTTGEWGTSRQQTHMVHVEPGQSVDLDFVM